MKNFNGREDIINLLKEINSRRYRVDVSKFDSEPTAKDFTNLSEAIHYYNEQPHGKGISVRLCVLRPDGNGKLITTNEYLKK